MHVVMADSSSAAENRASCGVASKRPIDDGCMAVFYCNDNDYHVEFTLLIA